MECKRDIDYPKPYTQHWFALQSSENLAWSSEFSTRMFKVKDLPFCHRRREIRRSNRCKIAISMYHFTNTENKFHKYEPLSLFLYSQEAPASSHLEIILFTRTDFFFCRNERERGARENPWDLRGLPPERRALAVVLRCTIECSTIRVRVESSRTPLFCRLLWLLHQR
jgi:hypothetical protein